MTWTRSIHLSIRFFPHLPYHCTMELHIRAIEDLNTVTAVVAGHIKAGYFIFLLEGDLGAGKTTLVQTMCKFLGVDEPVTSPTFSLVNEYTSDSYGTLYHMDLYRLDKEEDLVQIGLEEYLDSGNLCFIEWPEIARKKFDAPYILIKISVGSDNIRIFNITTHDAMDA